MKKVVLGLLVVFLLASVALAADDMYPEYKGEPVTLTMWAWTSNEDYSIREFEKVYPNIKVQWENFGVHYEKAQTAIAAGEGLPDVLMIEYTYAPEFMDLGAFVPINKWLPREKFVALFGEPALNWCALDDNIYGTPQDSGAISLFYRKDIFDKHGFAAPQTWAEFAEQARKLRQADPNLNYATVPLGWALWWAGLVWEAGGKLFDYKDGKWYIDFTNPVAEKVFSFWGELIDEGTIKIEQWWSPDWYNSLNVGKTAAVIIGCWFAEWLRYNAPESEGLWRVAIPPQWDPANPHNGMIGGSGFYVTAHSKNPEAAAIFVMWLNSHPESLKCLHKYSNLPVMVSTRYEEVLDEVAGPDQFFGGQNIVETLWEAHKLVDTSYVALPILTNVDQALGLLLQDYVDGKIKKFADILPMWEEAVVKAIKELGYDNVVVGELP
ncbi:MAG: sugar ABC transporter substrate-binding protein [Atribacterota bacterium]